MFQSSFSLGIWNAWILQVIYFIVSMQPLVVRKLIKGTIKKESKRLKDISPTHVKDTLFSKILYWFLFIIFIISFVITFFLPLQIGTIFFPIGLLLFSIGVIILFFVIQSWLSSPSDKPITSGIYQFSRHPMYISMFFSYIGISITTLSWVFLLLTLIHIFFTILQAKSEEEYCLSKYGHLYQNYMKNTPRWIGFNKAK